MRLVINSVELNRGARSWRWSILGRRLLERVGR